MYDEIINLLRDVLVVRERRYERAVAANESPDVLDLLQLDVLEARIALAREVGGK